MDWDAHKLHRERRIASDGQWVGLLDAEGTPIMDLPPIIEMKAPETRNAPESFEATVLIRSADGTIHRIADELIATGLSSFTDGKFTTANQETRLIALERAGLPRRLYRVAFCQARGGVAGPDTLTIHGVDGLGILNQYVAWSHPRSIKDQVPFDLLDRDWTGKEFEKQRRMKDVKLAAVADGFIVEGAGDVVIWGLIRDSLAAAYRAFNPWRYDPIIMGEIPTGVHAPNIMIRPQDGPLWDTIAPAATQAGVNVTCRLWLPGDDKPRYLPSDISQPRMIVDVKHIRSE